jgi:hypothetical protein
MSNESDRPWRQQPPQPQPGPVGQWGPALPPPGKKSKVKPILIGLGAFIVTLVVIGAATGGGKKHSDDSAPVATTPAVLDATTDPVVVPTTDDPVLADPVTDDPTTPDAPETVTYIVSGSSAQVTYGPAGSSLSGRSPMKVTRKLGDPAYYAISAQLNGGGHVSCKLVIDGEVVSQAQASGSYQIAMCEAVNFGGEWEDANSG